MSIRFGPAGNSQSFADMGFKHTSQVPGYLQRFGLNAFEYQCGRGVSLSTERGREFAPLFAEKGIALSLHAPYYISLASVEEQKRQNSIRYILESARAIKALGGQRIVVHAGACAKMERSEAMALACQTLRQAIAALNEQGYSDIIVCPETMGKMNQLGTLEEVLTLCSLDERMLPCIDFGHINARTQGSLKTKADYAALLDLVENALGRERAGNFHSHFSKIEYTQGGEKQHLTFADTLYGPEFEPLAELVAQRGYTPVFICESSGTQAEDAAEMMRIFDQALQDILA